jgi:hypothetical protein
MDNFEASKKKYKEERDARISADRLARGTAIYMDDDEEDETQLFPDDRFVLLYHLAHLCMQLKLISGFTLGWRHMHLVWYHNYFV